MEIKRQKLGHSQEQLIVEVNPEELKPFLSQAAFNVSLEHKIPGFRQGKVPFEILKEKIGLSPLWQEAGTLFIKAEYNKILEKTKLNPIDYPKIEILNVAPDQPFIFRLTLICLPKILSLDYSNIKIESAEPIKVEEKEIEKIFKNLQFSKRKESIADRPAQLSDRVEVDLFLSFKGVPLEDGQVKNFSLFLGEDYYIPGFSENLIGLRPNETKTFSLKYPEDHIDKKLAGKTIDFKVKINNIYSIDLPPVNDEFAQGFGFKNLEEMKNRIKDNLEKEALAKKEQEIEIKIFDELLKKAEIEEIPDILIDRELDKMIEELKNAIERENDYSSEGKMVINFEDYLKSIKKTERELRDELRTKAEERIKISLIIQEIAQREKISPSPEEIEEEIKKIAELEKDSKKAREQLNTEAVKNYIKNLLINRKVIDRFKK